MGPKTKEIIMKLKDKRIKDPKQMLDEALGNNAEEQKKSPEWDESFLADMQIKEMCERWDR